jgi:hypothetical protein
LTFKSAGKYLSYQGDKTRANPGGGNYVEQKYNNMLNHQPNYEKVDLLKYKKDKIYNALTNKENNDAGY